MKGGSLVDAPGSEAAGGGQHGGNALSPEPLHRLLQQGQVGGQLISLQEVLQHHWLQAWGAQGQLGSGRWELWVRKAVRSKPWSIVHGFRPKPEKFDFSQT